MEAADVFRFGEDVAFCYSCLGLGTKPSGNWAFCGVGLEVGQALQQAFGLRIEDEVVGIFEVVEPLLLRVAEHVVLRGEEAEGVEQAHGFAAQPQLVGDQDFERLVQCTDAAGGGRRKRRCGR